MAAGTATAVVVATSDVLLDPELSAATRAGFVVANVAGGAYTWWRRPASGFGPLFAMTGLLFALTSLNALADQLPFTLGRVLYAAVMVVLVYVFLAFPHSRLRARRDRLLVAGLAAGVALVWVALLSIATELPPAGPFSECAGACPENALRIFDGAEDAGVVLGSVANALTVASLLAVAVLLPVRMRGSSHVARRSLAPLFVAMSALLVGAGRPTPSCGRCSTSACRSSAARSPRPCCSSPSRSSSAKPAASCSRHGASAPSWRRSAARPSPASMFSRSSLTRSATRR